MKKRLALGFFILMVWPAMTNAQGEPWRILQGTDGTLYLLADNVLHRVVPMQASAELVAFFPQGEPWDKDGGLVPILPASTPAAVPPAPAVPQPGQPTWQRVGGWTGSEKNSTEQFTLRGGQQRVPYQIQSTARFTREPFLCLTFFRPDGRQQEYSCVRSPEGTWNLYLPAGTYYLELEPSSTRYAVGLDELR